MVVDLAMLVDRHQLTLLLAETARFAQHVFFVYGTKCDDPAYRSALACFEDVVSTLRFRSLTRLQPSKAEPNAACEFDAVSTGAQI